MQRSLRRAALAAAIFSATIGCTRTVVQQNKQPPDPLLISKKPVEGKPTSLTGGRDLARIDPQPPTMSTDDTRYTAGGSAVPVQLSSELVVRPDR
jgi:hypothetical protein